MKPVHDTGTATAGDQIQDLIALLLDQAVAASYALAQLHTLTDAHPGEDPTAHADVGQAITNMADVRSHLIANADQLTRLLQGQRPG